MQGWEAVRRYPRNVVGRDFVISDIHGAFELVIQAMKVAKFDPRTDRLFVNGDLVDRGDESLRAKRFLEQKYVFAACGNHERWWSSFYEEGPPDEATVELFGRRGNMGVGWWLKAPKVERDALVEKFKALPLAMEVETERGLVGIVHADVPAGMSWPDFTAALRRGDKNVLQTALWGRSRIAKGDESGVQGVGRVFVGHTPQWAGVKRLGNVYAVDTGAIFGLQAGDVSEGRLTMALLVAATGELAGVKDRLQSSGLVDLRDAVAADGLPFGGYAEAG
jgi:serine/threonine protein phosphatase 1